MANQYVPALPFDGTEPSIPLVSSKVLTPTIRPYCTTTPDAERMTSVIVQVSPITVNNEAFKPERLLDSIKTHLTDPKDAYRKWYARLLPHFENQWKAQGIDKAILLSTQPLYLHDKVLMAMAAFWHSQTGAFFLPSGPMGPTLMDVAVIAHLPITGEDPVLVSLGNQELPPNHQGWALAKLPERERGWTYFVNKYQGKEDTPVSELEHTAFLLFWLCRYIILSPSKLVLSTHIDLAIYLACGHFCSLGTLFLANLFEGLSRVSSRLTDIKKADTAASGPFWFLELWFRLYFPSAFFGRLPISPNPYRSIGYALARLTPNSSCLKSSDSIITQILTEDRNNSRFFVYTTLIQYSTDLFFLYPDPTYPLTRPDPLPHPTFIFSWDAAIKPRSLFSSRRSDKKNRRTFFTYNYQPQFLSRQFGCCQGIPGPLASPHLIFQSPEGLVIPELIPTYISQLTTYITSNSYLPFCPKPSTTEDFPSWWSTTWSLLAPSTDQLVGRLAPPPALALGSARLAVRGRKRPDPTAGGSGAKRQKAKATPAIDRQAIEEYLASLPIDTSGMPKYLRQQFEDPSMLPTTGPTTSQPTHQQSPEPQVPINLSSSRSTAVPIIEQSSMVRTTDRLAIVPITTQPTHRQLEAHRPGESMGRVPPPPASDIVAVMPDQLVVLPDQVAEPQQAPIEDVVLPDPDQVVALPDPLVQQVDEVPIVGPEPVQPEPVQPPDEVEEISSSRSGEASVNFAPLDPGMDLAAAQQLPPGDESVAGPITRPVNPSNFQLMAPSEATAALDQAAQEMNILTRINLPTPVRTIVERCANLDYADLELADLSALVQVAISLLVQPALESGASPVLDRMMARITELQAELPLIRPPLSEATSSRPAADPNHIEADLKKANQDLSVARARLDELRQERQTLATEIAQKTEELRRLQERLGAIDDSIQEGSRLVETHCLNQASLCDQLQAAIQTRLVQRHQEAYQRRRAIKSELKWADLKTALRALLSL
ncbi:uncharacterized protein LOC127266458 isoform X3 [Andrographis paniculata]|uniref:uncharacterized protein LOC127266458 isoform X3 n=1 Tax=Andrographis paniculata TaxID=175694 RepID=UPI0021E82975|nr:uncharacterized protein LOC127266458 isoform X3 [Andrographis paniculata]